MQSGNGKYDERERSEADDEDNENDDVNSFGDAPGMNEDVKEAFILVQQALARHRESVMDPLQGAGSIMEETGLKNMSQQRRVVSPEINFVNE